MFFPLISYHIVVSRRSDRSKPARPADLIKLDVILPGLNSFQVSNCVREPSAVPIIFMNALGQDQEKGRMLELGADEYATRPLNCKTIGMSMTGISMTVPSTVNAPAGSSYVEGTTACDFRVPTDGTVVIQPEQ